MVCNFRGKPTKVTVFYRGREIEVSAIVFWELTKNPLYNLGSMLISIAFQSLQPKGYVITSKHEGGNSREAHLQQIILDTIA